MENAREKLGKLCGGRPVALWGKGVSTLSVEKLLARCGIESVYYTDSENENFFGEDAAKNHALAVYSPSFKNDHVFFETAKKHNVAAIGEPDLAGLLWQGNVIAISGTNGKTTLASFIAHALNKAGYDALALGNIGKPMCEYADQSIGKTAVCELSSFQGMRLKSLLPDAFLWTNFAPDHLDWHLSMREYFEAKLNIARLLKNSFFIAGRSVKTAADEFGMALPLFAEIVDEDDARDAPKPFNNSIQSQNYALAKKLWQKLELDENILKNAAADFSLAAHRFSKTAQINGVSFWNDSKATNAHAAIAALKELKGRNVFWIGGGKNKYCDIEGLVKAVSEYAQGAALIGQTAEILKEKLPEMPMGVKICKNLEEAVKLGFEKSENNGNVLFSPGFSSFGMFKDYADRGKSFENLVLCLK